MPRAASRPLPRRSCRTLGPGSRNAAHGGWGAGEEFPPRPRPLQRASPCGSSSVGPSRTSPAFVASPGPPVRWRSARGRCCSSPNARATRGLRASIGDAGVVPKNERCRCRRGRSCLAKKPVLRGWPCIAQTGTMNTVLSVAAAELDRLPLKLRRGALITAQAPAPNSSIERTCLKPLRAFSAAAHVER